MKDTDNINEDGILFLKWLEDMGWDERGGVAAAADALGKNVKQIGRYKTGAVIPLDTRLAMTAIAEDLKPWDPSTKGLPALHFSISLNR